MKKSGAQVKTLSRLFFQLSLVLLLTNCSNLDETRVTEVELDGEGPLVTDAWICDIKSFEEDFWYYELYVEESGDYIAISKYRILKVSRDGLVKSMILITQPDEHDHVFRIFNNRIYRFHTANEFQDYDPEISVGLQIYDFDFNLLSEHILDTKGLIFDVELESESVVGMLIYDADASSMTLKKLHINDGLILETILSTSGTNPTNLHILENGNYLCTATSTRRSLVYLDNQLNLLWEDTTNDLMISDAQYFPGKGIYIAGSRPLGNFEDSTIIGLLDEDGSELNFVEFDAGDRWSPRMEVTQDRVCLIQTEPESGRNMLLSIFNHDLQLENSIDIPGNYVQSEMVRNENGSISFVYGIAIDPDDPDFFPESNTRIFKFDETYTLPTNIIVQ